MTKRSPPTNHLRAWRLNSGLSQEQLANKIGRTKGSISRYEAREGFVRLEVLTSLAQVYGVDPVALLLSPNDIEFAKMLSRAKHILEAASPEAAAAWLETGRHIAGPDPSKPPSE